MSDADPLDRRIGDAVRTARRDRHLTTRQLAGLAGISQPTLSNIENGRVRAGVATLYQIAEALGVPPGRFLSDGAGRHDGHDETSGGVRLRALPAPAAAQLEAYEITVPAGHSEERAFQHAGEDLIVILAGRGELALGERTLAVREGDVLWLDATSPHRFAAAATEALRAQVVTARGRGKRPGSGLTDN
ncbi:MULTISPECIES: helix-turn-helix domain-containing protein [Microbacterium]|uniref:helix-turn-helix domain-containing protein n=1 Tax=Microbacterium TaxID=33882 RepID=UPI00277E0588|nr:MULTISPECIES: XRE family transcriptional regulator [Microbacterium]MDQ1085418.1 transcriptional regulator with XRE-family HTH domain [Microbacterium sp. SORGH_AS_0344]MDQ1169276.1 transcriptional regulator with XRE-family HTH domain [Microbacterium proteolyticum]